MLVEVAAGDRGMPAVVASSGTPTRVLWLGGFLDLDWDAYRKVSAIEPLIALAKWWVAWLAPK